MAGSAYAIDTNVIIDFFKEGGQISNNLINEDVFIPSIVVGELFYGAYASSISTNRNKRLKEILSFIELYPILEVSEYTSDIYGEVKALLKEKGTLIPENDIWIAAIVKRT